MDVGVLDHTVLDRTPLHTPRSTPIPPDVQRTYPITSQIEDMTLKWAMDVSTNTSIFVPYQRERAEQTSDRVVSPEPVDDDQIAIKAPLSHRQDSDYVESSSYVPDILQHPIDDEVTLDTTDAEMAETAVIQYMPQIATPVQLSTADRVTTARGPVLHISQIDTSDETIVALRADIIQVQTAHQVYSETSVFQQGISSYVSYDRQSSAMIPITPRVAALKASMSMASEADADSEGLILIATETVLTEIVPVEDESCQISPPAMTSSSYTGSADSRSSSTDELANLIHHRPTSVTLAEERQRLLRDTSSSLESVSHDILTTSTTTDHTISGDLPKTSITPITEEAAGEQMTVYRERIETEVPVETQMATSQPIELHDVMFSQKYERTEAVAEFVSYQRETCQVMPSRATPSSSTTRTESADSHSSGEEITAEHLPEIDPRVVKVLSKQERRQLYKVLTFDSFLGITQ